MQDNSPGHHQMPFPFMTDYTYSDGTTVKRMMDAADIMKEFGVKKWPDGAVSDTVINGRIVWVKPKTRKRMEMRVFTFCPGCGRVIAVGKLAQHMRYHRRVENGQPTKRGGY